jgi:hypothetical protein
MVPREEFWSIMEAYGAGIAPAQIVFYVAAILVVAWALIKPGMLQSLFVKLYLSVAFLWIGLMFYLILARDLAGDSYGNYFVGLAFLVVSALFTVDCLRQRMQFSLPVVRWERYATLVLLLLVFCYPLFGIALGHSLTSLIVPGTFPCATVALGLLLLTTALPRVDKVIYVVLLLLAIPSTPFVQIARYGVYEDTILLAAGFYSLFLLWRYWRVERLTA